MEGKQYQCPMLHNNSKAENAAKVVTRTHKTMARCLKKALKILFMKFKQTNV